MNKKIIIVDDFYDIAHKYHKSFFEGQLMLEEETTQKISHILGRNLKFEHIFNEIGYKSEKNNITANLQFDFIAVIYLTLPTEFVSEKGISFYRHKKTDLESFPNIEEYKFNGWESPNKIFNTEDSNEWEEYSNIFVKYNRCVIFKADYWHSYGNGFGDSINNSMLYQKLLIKDVC